MSHLTQSMVEQFFELEKESARGVLRKEMDSAMDTIFKQMKQKLMMLVDNVELGNETGHELTNLGDPVHHEQQLYDNFNYTNNIPSTAINSLAQFSHMNVSNLPQQGGSYNRQPHEQQLYSSSNQILSTTTNSRTPDISNSDRDDEILVKNELDEIVNIIPIESISPSSIQPLPFNEQSNDNDDDLFDELDDEEEDCDCPDCVGDEFVVKVEGDDQDEEDDDDVQLIDESNDFISRPTKRPRLENDQVQPDNQTSLNQYITISLKCPQCSQMYLDRNALNLHLKTVHSIFKYRCLYKDCNQSFDNKHDLTRHRITVHLTQPNSIWPCGYCLGHFKNHRTLQSHQLMQHEEGLFQCAQPECQFVGELKQTVLSHLVTNHREFVCQHAACSKRYPNATRLKIHERTHIDVKPYRCKWPKCKYAGSAYKQSATRHIREHLKKVIDQNRRTNISNDPNDYLEVVHELL